jgi:hypothetical protein
MKVYDDGGTIVDEKDKETKFLEWITELSNNYFSTVQTQLRPRALKLFEDIFNAGASFSPGDFNKFGFNSIPAMRPHIKDLETVGLVLSSKDETDSRRKSIQLTAKGQFVGYAIKQKK